MSQNENIPNHIAVIIDGNGRWAIKRGENRSYGHKIGTQVVFDIAKAAASRGIGYLTIYALSIDNLKRPKEEVDYLIGLFQNSMDEETILKNNIRFRFLGKKEMLPERLVTYLLELEKRTAEATGMVFTLCVCYSAKWELTEAVKRLYKDIADKSSDISAIEKEDIARCMPSSFLPDPDLIIRSGGEKRLSDFMLWQASYSELYFTETLWPDFTSDDLNKAIRFYQNRDRRYGNIN